MRGIIVSDAMQESQTCPCALYLACFAPQMLSSFHMVWWHSRCMLVTLGQLDLLQAPVFSSRTPNASSKHNPVPNSIETTQGEAESPLSLLVDFFLNRVGGCTRKQSRVVQQCTRVMKHHTRCLSNRHKESILYVVVNGCASCNPLCVLLEQALCVG